MPFTPLLSCSELSNPPVLLQTWMYFLFAPLPTIPSPIFMHHRWPGGTIGSKQIQGLSLPEVKVWVAPDKEVQPLCVVYDNRIKVLVLLSLLGDCLPLEGGGLFMVPGRTRTFGCRSTSRTGNSDPTDIEYYKKATVRTLRKQRVLFLRGYCVKRRKNTFKNITSACSFFWLQQKKYQAKEWVPAAGAGAGAAVARAMKAAATTKNTDLFASMAWILDLGEWGWKKRRQPTCF